MLYFIHENGYNWIEDAEMSTSYLLYLWERQLNKNKKGTRIYYDLNDEHKKENPLMESEFQLTKKRKNQKQEEKGRVRGGSKMGGALLPFFF